MVFENMVALLIAAEKKCPQEVAFKYLDRLGRETEFKRAPVFSWTYEDMQDVLKFRQEGISDEEIASYYGVKASTIVGLFYKKITKTTSIKPRKRGTRAEIQEMLKLSDKGYKPRELANKFHINMRTVYSRIQKSKKKAEVCEGE
ncbi:hypothetical protein D9O40_00875 [Clostridium autoethanogenum]|uniref:Uncharacterized protein n=1 Tax=Clostridium autoethanogenum TaxID=84023 RepID=A0A3M0T2U3_9CLOT|nr:hypothetical protein [Clostridium autoethanogenum]RMD04934.1 hypothetical protein D9O40_00875 [Clostridium autoethanogenum]